MIQAIQIDAIFCWVVRDRFEVKGDVHKQRAP
jgi:hypothetical protein